MPDIGRLVGEYAQMVVDARRALHRIPEMAFAEKKTSAFVEAYLEREGIPVRTGIAGTGLVGLLEGGKSGPTVMIRADMDALPIAEETGLAFASVHEGMMHACGHDAHMAMALGAASVLNRVRGDIRGNVKFVFQPAEEGPGGARPMIEAGVMENPTVDYAIGCHVWPDVPEGTIGVRAGPFMAAMDRFDIRIIGKGGHGAMPHACVDALEVGTQVVSALQRIVSRHMNPLEPAVVSIGSFHAGAAFNIIPQEATLSGTTRTFNEAIWASWEQRLHTVLRGVCAAMGADYELTFVKGFPPTVNDDTVSEVVRRCAEQVVGPEHVVEPARTMGGEDMAYYFQRAKGCYYALGVKREGFPAVHNPKFNFNEGVLRLGVETHCRVALELLG
ncbi:MAG: amidohydrolase [Deltaproteobacteria bacterium]|nr:amidohydrolase [Deltaproteobacteria bacterium]